MIRRVLKDIRETWPYWSVLILAGVLAAIYISFHPVDKGYDPSRDLGPGVTQGNVEIWKQIHKANHEFKVASYHAFLVLIPLSYIVLHLIAVTLFGSEFKHQSMARILAQPISRSRIWWEKSLSFLAIVVTTTCCLRLAWIWACSFVAKDLVRPDLLLGIGLERDPFFPGWVIPIVSISTIALSSGLLASLLLRQTHTAFWAALVLPPAAFMACVFVDEFFLHIAPLDWFMTHTPPRIGGENGTLLIVGALWFCVVYPLAWLKFKNLEV